MAFLARGKKQDLRTLAIELGETVTDGMKIIDLKRLIENSKQYEESFVRDLLERIISDRKEAEEKEEQRQKEEIEERRRREEFELRAEELKLERAKMEASNNTQNTQLEPKDRLTSPKFDIQKLMPKFDPKIDDISLYLALFERQAKLTQVPDEFLVAQLISLLPSDITAIIACEPEEEVADYSYTKKLLLNRFKLGPESFRQLMVRHQKKPEATWKDFYYEIKNYFEEWLGGLNVTTFEQLKDLMIVDQIKKRVPMEIREHFVDIWRTF